MQLEARLVERVREHCEDLLHQLQQVGLVELVAQLGALEGGKHLQQQVEPRLGHVAFRVADGPDDGVHHQLGLLRGQLQQRLEAVVGDGQQQVEELEAVIRVILEVLGDHLQGALEHRLEQPRDLVQHGGLQLVHDGGKQREHLRVARVGHIAGVVAQDGVQHGRHEALGDVLHVLRLVHEGLYEPQHVLLYRAQQLHPAGERRGLARGGDALAD
mmetsp:Transcript_2464/g.8867  ORF Transcript_2464/g.8867 Transcript_2464/m.8867 type:complete len:215 (+) Transcript_2464:1493-2137(+)